MQQLTEAQHKEYVELAQRVVRSQNAYDALIEQINKSKGALDKAELAELLEPLRKALSGIN